MVLIRLKKMRSSAWKSVFYLRNPFITKRTVECHLMTGGLWETSQDTRQRPVPEKPIVRQDVISMKRSLLCQVCYMKLFSQQESPHRHQVRLHLLFIEWLTQKHSINCLTLSTLGKIFSWWHIAVFFLFFQKIDFDISCKLSPMETICMKCQILISWKNKKKNRQFVVCWICP